MERLCPQIDQLVSCYTCGDQTLPPYRLCANAHVCCPPCVQHLPRCRCGHQFTCDPQTSFDWLVLAMKLRCKHRGTPAGVGGGDEVVGDGTTGCNDQRWYGVQELREHYRSGCARNAFTCPLTGCGHVARVETIVEHYETAHGPIEELKPADRQRPYEVTLKIPSWSYTEAVRKIFNGYFLFVVNPRRNHKFHESVPQLSMQNINPSDMLQYDYHARIESGCRQITVTVSMNINPQNYSYQLNN